LISGVDHEVERTVKLITCVVVCGGRLKYVTLV